MAGRSSQGTTQTMANGNEQGPDSLVVRMLRDLTRKVDRVIDDLHDLKVRMTALKSYVNSNLSVINARVDRIDTRLDRIERRLELSEHA
jgi:hypothetical protein